MDQDGVRMTPTERERSVLRAAELYFFDGMTQSAIAERMGCTRWTVGRLLKEGEDRGIIDIRIRHSQARIHHLEVEMESRFGLADARVVATQQTDGTTLALVARAAAEYLTDIRPRPARVALGWGRTVAAISRAASPNWAPGARVIQAAASVDEVNELLASGPVQLLAQKAPGQARVLSATLRSGSAPGLRASDHAVLDEAGRAEVVLYSPGSVGHSSLLVRSGFVSAEVLEALWNQGARANVLSHIIDAEGNALSADLESRTMALELASLRRPRLAIAAASGVGKDVALSAALAAGLANVVVADSELAQKVLT